jgi:hypothetical protein
MRSPRKKSYQGSAVRHRVISDLVLRETKAIWWITLQFRKYGHCGNRTRVIVTENIPPPITPQADGWTTAVISCIDNDQELANIISDVICGKETAANAAAATSNGKKHTLTQQPQVRGPTSKTGWAELVFCESTKHPIYSNFAVSFGIEDAEERLVRISP